MVMRTLDDRAVRLFIALAAFFCVNAVLAEFIGVKIFALEDTLGIDPLEWNLFGQTGSLSFTAGTLLWPMVFILTDVINEFFGKRGVKFIQPRGTLSANIRAGGRLYVVFRKDGFAGSEGNGKYTMRLRTKDGKHEKEIAVAMYTGRVRVTRIK